MSCTVHAREHVPSTGPLVCRAQLIFYACFQLFTVNIKPDRNTQLIKFISCEFLSGLMFMMLHLNYVSTNVAQCMRRFHDTTANISHFLKCCRHSRISAHQDRASNTSQITGTNITDDFNHTLLQELNLDRCTGYIMLK